MNITELIDIALANTDDSRVEVTALEPAELSTEVVGGLAEMVFELVNNAIAFSAPDEQVRVAGLFDQDTYLISISDRGVGIPEDLMDALNRVLEDVGAAGRKPSSTLGIPLVARLAARHGIAVRLVRGVPGTTARVTVPPQLVRRIDDRPPASEPAPPSDEELLVDLPPYEHDFQGGIGESARSETEVYLDTEAFLESIFGPLMRELQESDRLLTPSPSHRGVGEVERMPAESPPPVERDRHGTATELRVRVPGESYSLTEDDSPSTAAAEAAIDIKSALSTFDQGRRLAELTADQDDV